MQNTRKSRPVEGFDFSSIGFGLPSLNALHLDDTIFQYFPDFMLLLAGCPNLEHLQVVDIRFIYEEEDSLTIHEFKSLSLPKLISVDITGLESSWFLIQSIFAQIHSC